jgi:Na+/melibiose symporter-like transporter
MYLLFFMTNEVKVSPALAGTALLFPMLPDTIEYDQLQSGLRREGVFSGLWSAWSSAWFPPAWCWSAMCPS